MSRVLCSLASITYGERFVVRQPVTEWLGHLQNRVSEHLRDGLGKNPRVRRTIESWSQVMATYAQGSFEVSGDTKNSKSQNQFNL